MDSFLVCVEKKISAYECLNILINYLKILIIVVEAVASVNI
ncbi:hypothetical protein [Clostridium yunnanense]|nr:hypothetical protein [Clostridium yunnanense]